MTQDWFRDFKRTAGSFLFLVRFLGRQSRRERVKQKEAWGAAQVPTPPPPPPGQWGGRKDPQPQGPSWPLPGKVSACWPWRKAGPSHRGRKQGPASRRWPVQSPGGPVQQQQLLPTLLACAAARGGLSRRATKPSRVGNQLVIGTAVFSGCGCRGTGNPAVL